MRERSKPRIFLKSIQKNNLGPSVVFFSFSWPHPHLAIFELVLFKPYIIIFLLTTLYVM